VGKEVFEKLTFYPSASGQQEHMDDLFQAASNGELAVTYETLNFCEIMQTLS
jgi:hypothetical protein